IASNTVPLGTAHPPENSPGNVSALSGWDFNTLSNNTTNDAINHYYFHLTNGFGNAPFTGTATLAWNRQFRATTVNNLDLFLYHADTGTLVSSSTSVVDNVEHLFCPTLPPGRYDLQVLKHGGTMVSSNETYALAFEFFSLPLTFANSNNLITFTWPI